MNLIMIRSVCFIVIQPHFFILSQWAHKIKPLFYRLAFLENRWSAFLVSWKARDGERLEAGENASARFNFRAAGVHICREGRLKAVWAQKNAFCASKWFCIIQKISHFISPHYAEKSQMYYLTLHGDPGVISILRLAHRHLFSRSELMPVGLWRNLS